MSFAFFFAGQGSQSLNMMNGFTEPIIRTTFNEASEALGQDLWAMITGDDSELIAQTVHTQPIMLTAGIAIWRAYLEKGGKQPSALAGHSLGEYSALVAAQALEFTEAVKLVRIRAQLMQNAVPQGEGAMAAILGLPDDEVKTLCAQVAQNEVVEAVNFNSVGQIVIAGNRLAVERAMEAAKQAGAKRALLLPVSVPSHCSLMKPAAQELAAVLENIRINPPKIRVIHNADVATHTTEKAIKDALVRQLYSPVLWTQTVEKLVSDGITQSAECTPGKVLSGLAKRIHKEAVCTALTDSAQLDAFIATH